MSRDIGIPERNRRCRVAAPRHPGDHPPQPAEDRPAGDGHDSDNDTHARTHVILLVQDLHVGVVNATTGELLRELTIDLDKDYQPRK